LCACDRRQKSNCQCELNENALAVLHNSNPGGGPSNSKSLGRGSVQVKVSRNGQAESTSKRSTAEFVCSVSSLSANQELSASHFLVFALDRTPRVCKIPHDEVIFPPHFGTSSTQIHSKKPWSYSFLCARGNANTEAKRMTYAVKFFPRKVAGVAVDAYREPVRLSTIRYDSGLANYLDVIDAQIQMYPAETASVNYDLGRKLALVDLYQALGGGWNLSDAQGTSAAPDTSVSTP
jgi:hypothetical protein